MMTDPVVLVPLDGSKKARIALPLARRLAELQSVSVRMLHVCEPSGPLAETADRLGLDEADLRGAALETQDGEPAAAILAAAAERRANLIVMSTHTADVRPQSAIGSVALAVLSGSPPCPVVLVDPDRTADGWALRRMLVPHDGSPAVSDALGPASELARNAGAEFVLLQVAADIRPLEVGSIAPPLYMDQPQHEWPVWASEFLARLTDHCPLANLRLRILVARGEAAAETIRVAKEEAADLIVLAWEGHWSDHSGAPTLKAVLRDTPCPLMVLRVPRTSRARPGPEATKP